MLLARVWTGKILYKHAEIGVYLEDVLRTVAMPDYAEHDVRPDRMRCFARNRGPSNWLRVVVSYEEIPALILTHCAWTSKGSATMERINLSLG